MTHILPKHQTKPQGDERAFWAPAGSFKVGDVVEMGPYAETWRIVEVDDIHYRAIATRDTRRARELVVRRERVTAWLAGERERVGDACLGSRP